MNKIIYNSPSNHGAGQNKCLKENCYEDKHTRPIAERADKLFKESGFVSIVADDNTGILNGERTAEANKANADLYITYHTNAFSDKDTRYLLFMCYRTDGEYLKLFNCVKKHMEKIYDGEIIFKQVDELYEINTPKAMTLYCEFGFHTNKKDCDDFIHEPNMIAEALVKGVCDYYGVKFKDGSNAKPTPERNKVVEEDELWGTETTKYTQILLGTPVDGIVSNQLYTCQDYLPNMLATSWEFESIAKGGSVMVKALQKLLDDAGYYKGKIDGYAGKLTVTALQDFLDYLGLYTGKIDGIAGKLTVLAWQKYLNMELA